MTRTGENFAALAPGCLTKVRTRVSYLQQEATPLAEQTPSSFDPFSAWRDWLTQFERQLNAFMNEQMSSDAYNRFSAEINRLFLDSQKNIADAVARSTNPFNLPTREEFSALSQKLVALEERVKTLEGTSGGNNAAGSGASETPRPPRTRKPASSRG